MSRPRYQGIVPPLITPLTGPDELDFDGLGRLVDHVVEGGVTGLFILGTSGEGPSLSHRLQREVVTAGVRLAADRVPVLVGVTDPSCEESVALAVHAAEAGADAVVIAPPYYFPAGQTELTRYVRHLVGRMPLPVMLYNMPSLTKVAFELETLRQVADSDRIVGIKDSGGDLDYFADLCRLRDELRPDWSLLIGPESKLREALAAGGDGGVNGGANLFPRLFVRLYEACVAGDRSRADELHAEAAKLHAIYQIGKYASRHIKAMKCGASLLGLCGDRLAEPFNAFLPPERDRVRAILDTIDRSLAT